MLKYFTKFYEGGAALTGGNMVAQNMCLGEKKITKLMSFFYMYISIIPLGPLYCRAGSGQCCPVVLRRGGRVECPALCAPDEEVVG